MIGSELLAFYFFTLICIGGYCIIVLLGMWTIFTYKLLDEWTDDRQMKVLPLYHEWYREGKHGCTQVNKWLMLAFAYVGISDRITEDLDGTYDIFCQYLLIFSTTVVQFLFMALWPYWFIWLSISGPARLVRYVRRMGKRVDKIEDK